MENREYGFLHKKKEDKKLQIIGTQSIHFTQAPYILASASVVGKKEGEGPIGNEFDMICDTDKFGEDTWEEAESSLQKESTALALGKSGLAPEDIRYIFAGDLLGQTIATSFGLMDYQIPLFGLYGACSTAGESMALGAMCVAGGYADRCTHRDLEPFCERGKTVPLSTGIRQSETGVGDLDGYGKRGIYPRDEKIRY